MTRTAAKSIFAALRRRGVRWDRVAIALLGVVVCTSPSRTLAADPVREQVERAKLEFTQDVDRLRMTLVMTFNAEIEAASARGDSETARTLIGERNAFERKGTAPETPAVIEPYEEFIASRKKNAETLVRAYERGIDRYRRAKKEADATELGRELRQFKLENGLTDEATLLRGHSDTVYSVAVSPNGKYIASGSSDGTLWLWDLKKSEPMHRLTGHSDKVKAVAFGPDSSWVVSASDDASVRFWRAKDGAEMESFLGFDAELRSIAVSRDGRWIAAGSDDGEILFGTRKRFGDVRFPVGTRAYKVNSIAFTPKGDQIVVAFGQTVQIVGIAEQRAIRRLRGPSGFVTRVDVSPDGRYALASSWDGVVYVWSLRTGKLARKIDGHDDCVHSARFSPDGRLVITAAGGAFTSYTDWRPGTDYTVGVWDVKSGRELRRFEGHERPPLDAVMTPDRRNIVSGGKDEVLRVWALDRR